MYQFARAAAFILAIALGSVGGPRNALAQTDLTPDQLRSVAANAVIAGEAKTGYALASALLKRDPSDVEALIIRARAARDMGRLQEAIETARRAWRSANSPSERFGASMVMAQALSTSGAKTRSQLWLRRAVQNAPNERFKDVAVRDFKYVQRSNPWATELSFSISPSSNINNGSAKSTSRLFDLPFEFQLNGAARALSGLQYSGGVATRYRLFENNRSQHDLLLQLNHRTYTMSDEAKRLAPTVKGSDFAFSSAGLSYVRRGFSTDDFTLPNQFELTLGRTWYAQVPYMEYARIGFTQSYALSQTAYTFAGVSREFQRSLSNRQDADNWSLSVGVRARVETGDRISFVLSSVKSNSLDSNSDFQQFKMRASYALARPVAGMNMDFGISASRKVHDTSRFSRFGRQDNEMALDVTAVFRQIEFYGFSPSVTLRAARTTSNIGLYDRKDFGLRVGIQSSF